MPSTPTPEDPGRTAARDTGKTFATADGDRVAVAISSDGSVTLTPPDEGRHPLRFEYATWAQLANYAAAMQFARRPPQETRAPAAEDEAARTTPDDSQLPAAAQHLDGATWVTIHDGALNRKVGRLQGITAGAFGAAFADVLVPGHPPTRIRVGALTAAAAPADSSPAEAR